MAPLKPLNTIVLWWSEGFQGGFNCVPMLPRDASLSDSNTLIAVICPVWQNGVGLFESNSFPKWSIFFPKNSFESSQFENFPLLYQHKRFFRVFFIKTTEKKNVNRKLIKNVIYIYSTFVIIRQQHPWLDMVSVQHWMIILLLRKSIFVNH